MQQADELKTRYEVNSQGVPTGSSGGLIPFRKGPIKQNKKKKGTRGAGVRKKTISEVLSRYCSFSRAHEELEEQKLLDLPTFKQQKTLVRSFIRSSFHDMLGDKPYRVHVRTTGDIASDASGVINTTQTDIAGLAASNDWTNFTAIFDEFLLEGVYISVEPRNKYSKVTTNSQAIIMTHDDDATNTLTAYANNLQAFVTSNTDDMFHEPVWFPRPLKPLYQNNWNDSQNDTVIGGTSFFANNVATSTTFGLAFYTFVVLFRIQFS
jgi:hypothetical protein